MYASVRSYRSDPAKMDELLGIADEKFVPTVSGMDGFCGYQMIDGGDGRLMTVSCFETREQAEASVESAAEFVRDDLADFDIERLDAVSGDVRVSVETDAVLQEAHV
jgi:hypothetical protein